ncbi:MAG: LD-carboxypeptidase [Archangium sp.]|nr:LD-carboxypeptidase [Archangium sp.]
MGSTRRSCSERFDARKSRSWTTSSLVTFRPVPPLAPGARVAVVAPSGPFDAAALERGIEVVSRRYVVSIRPVLQPHRYLAGTDAQRLDAVQRAFDDDGVSAVFAARGGYGAMRLLPTLRLAPKPVIGFSDVTALHAALSTAGLRSVHGPVVTQLGNQPADVSERLFALLEGKPVGALHGTEALRAGVAEGPLLGGNLSVLASLVGTRFMPSLRGAVLLLEDIGERPYRLDRMFTQLRLSGALDGVAGIALGEFTGCEEKDAAYSSAEVWRELIQPLGVPCVAGFAIGHGAINQPVVFGARVRLDAAEKTLTPLEGLSA